MNVLRLESSHLLMKRAWRNSEKLSDGPKWANLAPRGSLNIHPFPYISLSSQNSTVKPLQLYAWVQVLAQLVSSNETPGKATRLSVPQILHLQMGIVIVLYSVLW
jgi:hypothetical protein